MSVIKRDLDNIEKQFIAVNELLSLLSDIENTTIEKSAQWLVNHVQILNRTKKLVSINSYTLIEYEYNDNDFYNCPIKIIELVADGEDCELFSECVGFARGRLLVDLKNSGVNIDDNLIKNCHPYISKTCYESDDNFYKNQCIDLTEMICEKPKQELSETQKESINFVHFLDSNNPDYVPSFALLLRVHHDLNFIGRFEGTKQERIKVCLEEYGNFYNYQVTDTNIAHLANLIKTRSGAKKESEQAMAKILSRG